MGTNFYWIDDGEKDDIRIHIGKRSAAGVYCWDCGTTLCSNGTRDIHSGTSSWFSKCPCCGNTLDDNKGDNSVVMVELGFAEPKKQKGMSTACSFNWTLMSHKRKLEKMRKSKKKVVVDEYGEKFTAKEFLDKELSMVAMEFQSPYEFS